MHAAARSVTIATLRFEIADQMLTSSQVETIVGPGSTHLSLERWLLHQDCSVAVGLGREIPLPALRPATIQ
jgi:hypothetical protein